MYASVAASLVRCVVLLNSGRCTYLWWGVISSDIFVGMAHLSVSTVIS